MGFSATMDLRSITKTLTTKITNLLSFSKHDAEGVSAGEAVTTVFVPEPSVKRINKVVYVGRSGIEYPTKEEASASWIIKELMPHWFDSSMHNYSNTAVVKHTGERVIVALLRKPELFYKYAPPPTSKDD